MARKQYTKSIKAKVAMEALKGQKSIAEIASEYGVHSTQISTWKKQLVDGAEEVFSRSKKSDERKSSGERDRLFQKVGELQVEVDYLKKVRGSLK